MRPTLKSLLLVSLLLAATTTASAQCAQVLEDHMDMLMSDASESKVEITKSLGLERDIQKEGSPLQWRYDVYQFSLPKKKRDLLDNMIKTFEEESHDNPNCYGVNSMSESSNGDAYGNLRNLMIGEDPNRYVTIGKDYNNFMNINILDAADSTKTHRYAYALEWKEDRKGKVFARYIVTYAKIPSATSSIIRQDWPYLEIGPSRIPNDGPIQAPNKARVFYLGKEYSIQQLDSVIDEARRRGAETYKKVKEAIQREAEVAKHMKSYVVWADSLHHDTDPVTAVVLDLQQGKNITAVDLLCNDNILLIFSQLKQQYLAGQNTEFNAISIYTLCKKARECGFFTDPNSKAELEQLKDEVITLYNKTEDNTCDRYLKMALEELAKIS